jgi:hypothetical protein
LTEGRVVLRKGPQEYHSTPARPLARWLSISIQLLAKATRLRPAGCNAKLTVDPGSAVVETFEARSRVDEVAAGKDIDLTGNGLATKTTTITFLLFHWRHCYWNASFPN